MYSFYEFQRIRDFYREACTSTGDAMRSDLILKFIEIQALLLQPITPHWSEFVWIECLKKVNVFFILGRFDYECFVA